MNREQTNFIAKLMAASVTEEADIDFLFEDIPGYMETAEEKDPMVYKKVQGFLLPWTWYLYEADKEEGIFMAYVDGDFPECGSVSLEELKQIGLVVDKDFEPKRLSEIQKEVEEKFYN